MGSEVDKVLNRWADIIIANMRKILSDNRKVNTSQLFNSINKVIDSKNMSFSIVYAYYGKFVNSGRRAGIKAPPQAPLMAWLDTPHGRTFTTWFKNKFKPPVIKRKSIIKSYERESLQIREVRFLQRTIKNKGIKPVQFLNESNKIKWVNQYAKGPFQTDLQKAIIKETGSLT
jgi:hypothetical protein